MKATDLHPHHFARHPMTSAADTTSGDDDGSHVPWANEPGESFPSTWEAAWIDLGGEG